MSVDSLEKQILANKLNKGVTLSGGEPFEQCAACLELAIRLRKQGYNLWIYSGYTFEQLMQKIPDPLAPELLRVCDVLVDGPYKEELHQYDLCWRGSSNQRVIDLQKTFTQNEIILWQEYENFPEPPPSW